MAKKKSKTSKETLAEKLEFSIRLLHIWSIITTGEMDKCFKKARKLLDRREEEEKKDGK